MRGTEFGGCGAKQYHFVFSPDTHDKVTFANLPVTPAALPESFLGDLLALEKWPPAATLLTTPNNTISWPDNSSLRMWLPDVDSNLSPHHGITVCCGSAGDRARSHGHVFVGVPQGNINSVSIPVTLSNLFFLPLMIVPPTVAFSPSRSISLR